MRLSLGTLSNLCISRANGNWLSQIEKHVVVSAFSVTSGRGVGKSNLPQKRSTVLSEPKCGPPPSPMKNSCIFSCKGCYSELGANQGLCWRVQVNQFFSSYFRGSHIWKLCLAMCILAIEEQDTHLLRAFLIIRFPVVRWFLVLKHPD